MDVDNEINVYSDLSEKAKEVAPKIESLLNGLSINEISRMFSRIKNKVSNEIKVKLPV